MFPIGLRAMIPVRPFAGPKLRYILLWMPTEQEKQEQETDTGGQTIAVSTIKPGRRAFSHVRRELSEEEMSSPGARRLLLDNVDRLEDEVMTLRACREDFHRVDKRAAVLEEKLKDNIAVDVMYGVAIAAGFGLIGIVSNIWDKPYATTILCVALILVVGGIAVKVIKR
jgi:hypothetical protein